ncbi:MAG: hypothetical protein H6Q90_6812 [Deltaproteobacteria bacterium]|nr:hypothetical protein [Deltaproteobacteria bacterium]
MLLVAIVIGQLAQAAPAEACSWGPGPPSPPSYPRYNAEVFPTNGLFTSSQEWMTLTGPLELVDDAELSRRLAMPVRRPSSPLIPGRIYEPTECYTTSCTLVIGSGPDLTPPSRAVVTSLRTLLVRDPEGAGGFSCPDVDSLEIVVDGTDDTTPAESLAIGAYLGATPAEVAARTEIDVTFGYDAGPPSAPLQSTIYLGEAVGRMRDGEPFRAAGPFCFSVVMIDWAGNIGARSEVQCLDTTDPDDPTVEFVASSGCGCNAPADPGGAAPLVLAILVVSARSARRRRGSPRSPRTR